MESTARLVLALFLSMGAIYLWNHYYVNPKLEEAEKALKVEQARIIKEDELTEKLSDIGDIHDPQVKSLNELSTAEEAKSPDAYFPRAEIIKQNFENNSRLKIKANDLHGSINLRGLLFDDLTLAEFRETLDKDSPEVVLLSPKNTKELYFMRSGWAASGDVKVPDENSVWRIVSDNNVLSVNNPVVVLWDNGAGQSFINKISIDKKYMISIEQKVANNSDKSVMLSPFALANRVKAEEAHMYISHEGAIAVASDELKEITYASLREDGDQELKNVSGWAGITDKYWLTTIIPQDHVDGKFTMRFSYYRSNKADRYQVDMLGEPIKVLKNSEVSYDFNFYAGAKRLDLLDEYANKLNIKLFDRAIDFGIYYIITKPMLNALNFFNEHLMNFGLAIMALTICVKLLLFPLANKSYNSMARMRKHMPEMQRMKEKFKGDRQKLGTEMMKYYKEHKINPMSGCLPMILQIPIFFSLYKVLYVTIEMRHAPFYGWIKDLSAPDPTNIFNLFGLLPFTLPEWLPLIGVLPILFTLTMVVQQRLSPPPADETQRIVMKWMPWIFLFVFSNFAAGLVIYWIWNNILSIIQQLIITKKVEEDKSA